MKRITSLFLLLLFLSTTTEFYQLAKMPALVTHLKAHEAGNKNETFWSFLDEHYIANVDHNPDYAADMQLPFKEQNPAVAYNISTIVVIQTQQFFSIKPVEKITIDFPEYEQPFSSYTFPSNIWQPPKSC